MTVSPPPLLSPSTTSLTNPHQASLAWRTLVSPHSLSRPRHLPHYDDSETFSTIVNPLTIFNPQPLVANQSSITCICDIGDLYMLMCIYTTVSKTVRVLQYSLPSSLEPIPPFKPGVWVRDYLVSCPGHLEEKKYMSTYMYFFLHGLGICIRP